MKCLQTKPPFKNSKCNKQTRNLSTSETQPMLVGLTLEVEKPGLGRWLYRYPLCHCVGRGASPGCPLQNGNLAEGLLLSGSLILRATLSICSLKVVRGHRSLSMPFHFDSLRFDSVCVFLTFPIRLYVLSGDSEIHNCDRLCSFRPQGSETD